MVRKWSELKEATEGRRTQPPPSRSPPTQLASHPEKNSLARPLAAPRTSRGESPEAPTHPPTLLYISPCTLIKASMGLEDSFYRSQPEKQKKTDFFEEPIQKTKIFMRLVIGNLKKCSPQKIYVFLKEKIFFKYFYLNLFLYFLVDRSRGSKWTG